MPAYSIERPPDAGLPEREALCRLQVGRNPVHDTVADEVDEGVGHGDRPQVPVVEHVLEEDLPVGERLLVGVGVVRPIVVLVLLDRREAAGLWRVPQEKKDDDGDRARDERVEVELGAPVVEEEEPEQRQVGDERAADVVRHVPGRDHHAAFAGAEPVHHALAAGRPAHALDPPVERLDEDDEEQRGVDGLEVARHEHEPAGQQQAERQEELGVAAVRHRAHEELRDAVGNREAGERGPQLCLGELGILPEQVWNRQREVVANQVVGGVSGEDPDEDLAAESFVGRIDAVGRQPGGCRSGAERRSQRPTLRPRPAAVRPRFCQAGAVADYSAGRAGAWRHGRLRLQAELTVYDHALRRNPAASPVPAASQRRVLTLH